MKIPYKLIESCLKKGEWFELRGNIDKTYKEQAWIAQISYGVDKPQDQGFGTTPKEAINMLLLKLYEDKENKLASK